MCKEGKYLKIKFFDDRFLHGGFEICVNLVLIENNHWLVSVNEIQFQSCEA